MCKRFMEGMCNDRNIELRLECDPEVGMVRMDASLFEQVLVNIIKNAAESIEGDAGENGQQGEIIVRTTAPASVEVVDNGPGISKETEAKLFSPFFSTKPNGQGIGLVFIRAVCKGLSMRKVDKKYMFVLAAFFGGFQALMPALGWLLGSQFQSYITAIDHWIAFILLVLIGGKMILDVVKEKGENEEVCPEGSVRIDLREFFLLAIATSIDALAIGIGHENR